ncbi:MAG: DUF4358 domain-containing protein, partial [Oscillospiraceae bacterium]|nr:DUF4358 domain-containing protein [Oscillospiraceae bacterium]
FLLIIAFITCFSACSGKTEQKEEKQPADEKAISLSTGQLAETVLESVEFPLMTEQTDPEIIEMFTGADFNDIEEIACFQQALTVHFAEILIIKPKNGRADAVTAFLTERQQMLKNTVSAYPVQEAAIEASVVGSKYNITYFICHQNASRAEKALLEKIEENIK